MGLYDTIIIAYIIIITHVGILIRRFQKVEQSVLYIVFFFFIVSVMHVKASYSGTTQDNAIRLN